MIVFTIIGVLFYWVFCFELGKAIAMAFDAKEGIDAMFKPLEDGMKEISMLIAMFEQRKATP